jgi:hypothetical protein
VSRLVLVATGALALALAGCGGAKAPPIAGGEKSALAPHKCREGDHVERYDLHDEDGQEAFVPCSKQGKSDLSGLVRIDTTPEGIQITIHATDDDFNEGALGSDLKGRDAIIVYPKGREKKGVEVPLQRTARGYDGKRLIPYDELEKLTDEGTKIEVSILDHDDSHKNGEHEELKISVAVSAGKSCEKAVDENPQTIDMGKKGGPDLTDNQLGGPMRSSGFFQHCGLPDDANAEICVAVKKGKPLGVSVKVAPTNNKTAACIDKATRKLAWPASEKLDVVKQRF